MTKSHSRVLLGASVALLVLGATAVLGGAAASAATGPAEPARCTPSGENTVCLKFGFTGADQSFTVPAGVAAVDFVVDGAGSRHARGGRTTGRVRVTAGQPLTITVGQQSQPSTAAYGGGGAPGCASTWGTCGTSGGGMSAVWNGPSFSADSALLVSGGAGGDADTSWGGAFGGDGGPTGQAGSDPQGVRDACTPASSPTTVAGGGCGGTTTAGGSAGYGASAGTQFHGGTGRLWVKVTGSGGGGGGWFGGGGGTGSNTVRSSARGGGGGGSNFVAPSGVERSTSVTGAGAVADGTVTLEYALGAPTVADQATARSQPIVTGTAPPGTTVNASAAESLLCSATAGAGGQWSCESTEALADGTHVITAAWTSNGISSALGRGTVRVDTTAPSVRITSVSDSASLHGAESFTFTADEPADFECAVDGTAFTRCSSPFTTEKLSHHLHTFQVRATDEVGNRSDAASKRFSVSEPDLHLSFDRSRVHAGDVQTATGTGFAPGERVTAAVDGTAPDLGDEVANGSGEVQFRWTVPVPTGVGKHSIALTGDQSGSVEATFSVIDVASGHASAGQPTPADQGPTPVHGSEAGRTTVAHARHTPMHDFAVNHPQVLAFTGTDVLPIGGSAIVLLLLGIGLFIVHQRHSDDGNTPF